MTHYFVVSVIKTSPTDIDSFEDAPFTRTTEYRDVCDDSATALCELINNYASDLPEDQHIIVQRIRSY